MLVLFLSIVLNIVVSYIFLKSKPKNLHNLEILVYWMIGAILFQNYLAVNNMNYKYFIIPENSLGIANVLSRIMLIPLLYVWFLNEYVSLKTVRKKAVLFCGFLIVFVGAEWLSDRFGILIHVIWNFGWTIVFWITSLLLSIGSMKIFRYMLNKEVHQR